MWRRVLEHTIIRLGTLITRSASQNQKTDVFNIWECKRWDVRKN